MDSKKTLIICPVFNEKYNIIKFFQSIINYLNLNTHILFLDDFSTDGSRELFLSIKEKINKFSFIGTSLKSYVFIEFNEKNLGYGENLFKGFGFALEKNYDFIMTIDCDFQHLPFYIPLFLSLSRKYDFVTGTRYSVLSTKIDQKNFYRYMINKKMLELLHSFFKLRNRITDFFCGFRVYNKKLLGYIYQRLRKYKKINYLSNEKKVFSYEFPIYLWIDILNFTDKIKEVPIPFLFFSNRNFKGYGSDNLIDHYRRIEQYVEIFLDYYRYSRNLNFV